MQQPAPPDIPVFDQRAEENLVGACLLSPVAIEAARELLSPSDFYYPSLGSIYRACVEIHDAGDPVDGITVGARLRTAGILDTAGGESKLSELVALVPAASNAGHYARIVRETSRARAAVATAQRLTDAARNGGLTNHPEVISELEQLLDTPAGRAELRPLWWHDAMTETVPETTEYVQDVLQTGVLADIVGLPYLHKTAIALELATKVARGTGFFLGRYEIRRQAPVAYFWADDSRAKEIERIQAYGQAHELNTIQLAMYLNPGLVLPDDLPAVKAQIREHGYRLIVFDSLYNFCPGIDFTKDHAKVTSLYHALKRVCDQIDGLTIVLVDHSAKPSESNRGRHAAHSSFGSIFKAASVRCTIAVERADKKLYVSATGNNVRGFDRTPAFFADQELEVRLVEDTKSQRTELDEAVEQMWRDEILTWLTAHPDKNSNEKIRKGIGRKRELVADCLERMAADGLIEDANAAQTTLDVYNDSLSQDDAVTAPRRIGERSGAVQAGDSANHSPARSGSGRARSWRIVVNPTVQAEKPLPAKSGERSGAVLPATGSEFAPRTSPQTSPPTGEVQGEPAEPVEPDNDDIDFNT